MKVIIDNCSCIDEAIDILLSVSKDDDFNNELSECESGDIFYTNFGSIEID